MEYLMIFFLGIVVYNYILPVCESITSCIVILCMSFKTNQEIKINEKKCEFSIKYGQGMPAVGFNTNVYPEEDVLEEEDYEDDDEENYICKKIGF